jgi:hypothetical protein
LPISAFLEPNSLVLSVLISIKKWSETTKTSKTQDMH